MLCAISVERFYPCFFLEDLRTYVYKVHFFYFKSFTLMKTMLERSISNYKFKFYANSIPFTHLLLTPFNQIGLRDKY